VSKALDAGKKINDWGEANAPLAETAAFRDLRFQFGWIALAYIAEAKFFTDADLAAGPHETFPLISIIRPLACQQNFYSPAEKISGCWILRAWGLGLFSASVAVEPGREHARIVQDQQVAGLQQVGEFAKRPILPALTLPTARMPSQMQQARTGAVRQRLLRNAFRRQIIMEVRDEHRVRL
jgi:hypothetical protein